MAVKRIQNRIAGNRLLLPMTSILALLIFGVAGLAGSQAWKQLPFLAVSVFLMSELNKTHALIRIYSRSISSSFLLLSIIGSFLYPDYSYGLVQLCLVAFYTAMFGAYYSIQSIRRVYFAFLCLGVISGFYVQILFVVPFVWMMMAFSLRIFHFRTWTASLLGLLTPYWFGAVWLFYQSDFRLLAEHFSGILPAGAFFDYDLLSLRQRIITVYLFLLFAAGGIHFYRKKYMDKLRTRLLYQVFATMNLLLWALLVIQPAHSDCLIPLVIVNTAPFIAHFVTLTNTRFTNLAFLAIILITFTLIGFQLWTL